MISVLNERERSKIEQALYYLGVEGELTRESIADWLLQEYSVGALFTPSEVEAELSHKCSYCGANIKKYWHRLTPALVSALVKLRHAVIDKGENKVHLLKDFHGDNELTRHEWNNFTKLRYHGLAVKYKDDNGKREGGYWLLTRRGSQFLRGEISIPYKVQTFRNRVVAKSDSCVYINEVVDAIPFIETVDDIDYDIAEVQQLLF